MSQMTQFNGVKPTKVLASIGMRHMANKNKRDFTKIQLKTLNSFLVLPPKELGGVVTGKKFASEGTTNKCHMTTKTMSKIKLQ